ncbi:pH-response regulator protein palA/RIM20 [Venturia nashicola]|uniref:pH-response regulator protein palA/RIM20 n=1 Tax=Venturia nashicola TaxID=86259 RepID=A0A4Z1NWH6_9PEZI|nr:pH-response regulator protein palA/RIM20 [Venturia nashicola]
MSSVASTTPSTSTTPLPTTPTTPINTATTTGPTPTATTPTSLAPVTSVVTASSVPPTTQLITSVVVASTSNGSVMPPSTVVVTVVSTPPPTPVAGDDSSRSSATASSTSNPALNGHGTSSKSGGLSPAGTIAISVVIPIVVIAALVFAGLFFWRRRKQQKMAEEERRKEMEAYGFNPNNDPTLPAVGGVAGASEMMEDDSGYRGWGAATTTSNKKASTAISSGLHPSSDGGYHSPGSPNASDKQSGDPLVTGAARRSTMDSETIGALGGAPAAAAAENIRRGPSNASSSYSMGAHSNGSNDAPNPVGGNDYYTDNMYYGGTPYENSGPGQEAVIRDNPARRNTQIQRGNIYPQQGSSGIAQNF